MKTSAVRLSHFIKSTKGIEVYVFSEAIENWIRVSKSHVIDQLNKHPGMPVEFEQESVSVVTRIFIR